MMNNTQLTPKEYNLYSTSGSREENVKMYKVLPNLGATLYTKVVKGKKYACGYFYLYGYQSMTSNWLIRNETKLFCTVLYLR